MGFSKQLQLKLDDWAKTDAGKAKLKNALEKGAQNPSSSIYKNYENLARMYGEKMQEILQQKTKDAQVPFDVDILVSPVVQTIIGGKPCFVANVAFDSEKAHRDSLAPNLYEGVNIALLFDTGYEAQNHVFGTWHNKPTTSLLSRDGLHYIDAAIDEFNQTAPAGIVAIKDA